LTTRIEDDLIRLTTEELECSEEDIRRAIEIFRVYRKHKNREKQKRKTEQKNLKRSAEIQKEKDTYPERCFCQEEGIDVERSPSDKILRYEPRWNPLMGEFLSPVCECVHCGKEIHEAIYFA
jgi:hypothetical protein